LEVGVGILSQTSGGGEESLLVRRGEAELTILVHGL